MKSWYGWLAPAGTPRTVIVRLSVEVGQILMLAEVRDKLLSQGMESIVSRPEQMAKLITSDRTRFAGIIKTAGIRMDN